MMRNNLILLGLVLKSCVNLNASGGFRPDDSDSFMELGIRGPPHL
eukprot:COSAG02_NODE_2128_length_9740_cov_20.436833_10_plen_45_part_00